MELEACNKNRTKSQNRRAESRNRLGAINSNMENRPGAGTRNMETRTSGPGVIPQVPNVVSKGLDRNIGVFRVRTRSSTTSNRKSIQGSRKDRRQE